MLKKINFDRYTVAYASLVIPGVTMFILKKTGNVVAKCVVGFFAGIAIGIAVGDIVETLIEDES